MRKSYTKINLETEGDDVVKELEEMFPYIDITKSIYKGKIRAIKFQGEIRSET